MEVKVVNEVLPERFVVAFIGEVELCGVGAAVAVGRQPVLRTLVIELEQACLLLLAVAVLGEKPSRERAVAFLYHCPDYENLGHSRKKRFYPVVYACAYDYRLTALCQYFAQFFYALWAQQARPFLGEPCACSVEVGRRHALETV